MGIAVWFRKLYYSIFSSDKACREKVRQLLKVRIRSPFDANEIITLGDLLVSTAITEYEIIKIAESYGIKFPSEAVDISGNHALEYLLYHGKDLYYTYSDASGNEVIAGVTELGDSQVIDAIPLIPNSHLDSMLNWINTSGESFKSFFGHASEFAIKEQLSAMGIETYMPLAGNTPGYDLICNRAQFYAKYGINLPVLEGNPAYGVVQVKSATDIINPSSDFFRNTIEHLHNNPDIPVICSDKIYGSLAANVGANRLIPFSKVGINDLDFEEQVHEQFEAMRGLVPDESLLDAGIVVRSGLESSQYAEVINNSYESGFHLPLVAMAIRGGISSYKNYRLFKSGEISWQQGTYNVGRDVGKTAIISGTTIYATSAVTTALGLSVTESVNGIYEGWVDGFDWENMGDFAELGIILAIGAGIGYGIRKVWQFFVGDPLEDLKNLISAKQEYVINSRYVLNKYKPQILNYLMPSDREKVRKELAIVGNRLTQSYSQYSVKPLEYYVLEYKQELLDKIKSAHDTCESSINGFFDKIEKLARLLRSCQSERQNLDDIKKEFRALYTNLPKEVADVVNKINQHGTMGNFISSVLSQEIKQFVSSLKGLQIVALGDIEHDIDYYDTEIRRETNKQKRKGNL